MRTATGVEAEGIRSVRRDFNVQLRACVVCCTVLCIAFTPAGTFKHFHGCMPLKALVDPISAFIQDANASDNNSQQLGDQPFSEDRIFHSLSIDGSITLIKGCVRNHENKCHMEKRKIQVRSGTLTGPSGCAATCTLPRLQSSASDPGVQAAAAT